MMRRHEDKEMKRGYRMKGESDFCMNYEKTPAAVQLIEREKRYR